MTRPPLRESLREAMLGYREWLRGKGRDPIEGSAGWVKRVADGLPEAEAFSIEEAARRAAADRKHNELMRRLKDSDTR